MSLLDFAPSNPTPGALLDAFAEYAAAVGLDLYEAQEEAILELLDGNNVILNTPTGSGKSLVAAAAHFAALATNRRSIYTAPIKALVSEKFFALCKDFGSDNVGMITGDAKVNPDAPIICCTAEILANWALRDGDTADVDVVIMDEFHYYGDPQRGWAWQVPLLHLPHVQFLAMSATLGKTRFLEQDITERTGRPTTLVQSSQRPVPLNFEYRFTTLHNSLEALLADGNAPIYVVHFTQREATEAAQSYLSIDPLTKDEKARIKEAVGAFGFDTPIGKDLRRFVMAGIGVHHGGLLPKYRRLVERLAQEGLLKLICGTDSLGVGVNVPIRSVLFTQLCKYDGVKTRVLTVREFKQIAGRAGRKGFDDLGTVWVQAPAHEVENIKLTEKAATKQGKKSKVVKKKPPERGYAAWTEATFDRLVGGEPEPLTSSFSVTHQSLLFLLDRPGDGCAAVRTFVTDNHETEHRKRGHIRRAIAIYRSLKEANVLEFPAEPDDLGRLVRVNFDLQDEFALHQPLSLWAVKAFEELEPGVEGHHLKMLSIVEAVQENPGVIIAAQLDRAKRELLGELKAKGVEYDERMERLDEVRPPAPDREWIYDSFNAFRSHHPWAGEDNVKPKSVVREMLEGAFTFGEYVSHHGLKRSEGTVLRYLSDVYKGLRQNIPADLQGDDVLDLTEWIGALVRGVDSSLIDEWEQLQSGHPSSAAEQPQPVGPVDITTNARAFRVMVHNQTFAWVMSLAQNRYGSLELDGIIEIVREYFAEYDEVLIDADARSRANFIYDTATQEVTQIVCDPEGHNEWRFKAHVDLDASRAEGKAVVVIDSFARA